MSKIAPPPKDLLNILDFGFIFFTLNISVDFYCVIFFSIFIRVEF